MSERALRVLVSGRVQGVGFRAFACDEAGRRGVIGWVRNLDDGRVEAAMHGAGGALAELIGRLRQGPASARVEGLDVQSIDAGAAAEVPAGACRF